MNYKRLIAGFELLIVVFLTAAAMFYWCAFMPQIWPSKNMGAPFSSFGIVVALFFHLTASLFLLHLTRKWIHRRQAALIFSILLPAATFGASKLLVRIEENAARAIVGSIEAKRRQFNSPERAQSAPMLPYGNPDLPWHRIKFFDDPNGDWSVRITGKYLPFWDIYFGPSRGWHYVF
jgi:hypothetical protein